MIFSDDEISVILRLATELCGGSKIVGIYLFGSHFYGTASKHSDKDIYVVVDGIPPMDSLSINVKINNDGIISFFFNKTNIVCGNYDFNFYSIQEFKKLLMVNDIEAIECFQNPLISCDDFSFLLNKVNLRCSLSKKADGSFAKAKTLWNSDGVRARKSLWHSMRIFVYGCQIAQNGKIIDWDPSIQNKKIIEWDPSIQNKKMSELYSEIISITDVSIPEKYVKMQRALASEFRKHAPK